MGRSAESGPTTAPSERHGSLVSWRPTIAWWRARASGSGKRRCVMHHTSKKPTRGFAVNHLPSSRRVTALPSGVSPTTCRACGRRPRPPRKLVKRSSACGVSRALGRCTATRSRLTSRDTGPGGGESRHRVMRPVARYAQWSTYPRLLARIETLRHDGMRVAQMAEHRKRAGFYPPTRRDHFNGGMIARLLRRRGRHGPRPRAMGAAGVLEPHEYWRSD